MSNNKIISPGSWLGLLGGGQLGRMFCMAAQSLGYRVAVLDPGNDSPAGAVADHHIQADYLDQTGLNELSSLCRAVTTEFENVPAQSLVFLAQHGVVSPTAESVAIAQDRIDEKRFIASCGLAVAPHAVVTTLDDLRKANSNLFPGILKISRLGYDGKGQARVENLAEAEAAFVKMGSSPCVLEQRVPLALELSVVLARHSTGATAIYPVAENIHRDGILAVSRVPATSAPVPLQEKAREAALKIADKLNYVGVLCVEFFVLDDGKKVRGQFGPLLVNEIAPRPHNSGHYSIDACVTSQFEQQVRILAGLPLGEIRMHSPTIMLNLLGDLWFDNHGAIHEPDWATVLRHPEAHLHLYGKREPRPGRKMGHVTITAPNRGRSLRIAEHLSSKLKLPALPWS